MELRFDKAKGYIPGAASLISCIFVVIIFIVQLPLGPSLGLMFFYLVFGECWSAIVISMINVTLPHNVQGFANGFSFVLGTLLGSLLNLLMGAILTNFDSDQ